MSDTYDRHAPLPPRAGAATVVTGASSGIGEELARRLGRAGWAVGLVARRRERLEALAREIEEGGGRALPLPCDVSDREAVLEAMARCGEELGPVELVVANAGIDEVTEVTPLDGEHVARTVDVNLLGAVYPVEAVLPGMLERDRGQLVAIGSLAGYGGLPGAAAYAASKAALETFYESLRLDLRETGVRVTVVTPGYVDTEMISELERVEFMLEVDDAVDRILDAIRRERARVAFPFPLSFLTWIGQILPRGLYDRIAAGWDRKSRPPGS